MRSLVASSLALFSQYKKPGPLSSPSAESLLICVFILIVSFLYDELSGPHSGQKETKQVM